ncbi:hypothetical protein FD754_017221 [Muntiacus muntjak]|uniref:S-phase kinase-associated protein 2 n=1 Tax=Muntiacus muntjak TaxID=9888 RepID=A0A5N3VT57_MUNMU|nr:hypothetical protein FD754_017221 [Muntiacus muntjak]
MDQLLVEYFSPFCFQLSDPIVDTLTKNTDFLQLNLSGCSGFSESALKILLSNCSSLDELKLSWCFDFTEKHRSGVSTTVGRCPSLVHLDLSDTVMLKNNCFLKFYQLNYLQYKIPTLKTLQVFGIMPDGTPQLLKEALPHLQINCPHFTTIARLTFGNKNQGIWGIKC